MNRITYFCLYIASYREETEYFFEEIEKYCWKPSFIPHTIYFISLNPTIYSPHNGVWKWEDGELEQLFQPQRRKRNSTTEWTPILRECIEFILKQFHGTFDGFIYSGHGGGVTIGKWYRNKGPYFKLCDMISVFMEYHLSFPVMFFNSCYMGSFLSLLECNRITNWMVADPGYNAGASITTTDTFWRQKDYLDIGSWISDCVIEYHKKHCMWNYKCFMIFDLHVLPDLFQEMKQTDPMKWEWKRKYLLSKNDSSTFDLYSILKHMHKKTIHEQNMMKLIRYMMRYSQLCKRKRGPSIQWGRFLHMKDRYEGTIWWEFWKTVNLRTVYDGHMD
jgi:hypothetical protein